MRIGIFNGVKVGFYYFRRDLFEAKKTPEGALRWAFMTFL